ncbi:alpha-L-iduronidase isoform X2 [Anopheles stephensi]|uniref:alpha-L-iduronidase isoform X2 n=1 Tax=Anopheles stephensi TaxID=30069 RepID=UPI0016588E08|nr:alpha-L-iduronidase isoform X2 [Anopheles stephensi]
MWWWSVLLLLLEQMLVAWLVSMVGLHTIVEGGSSPVTTTTTTTSVQLARAQLVTARRMQPFWTSTGLCPPEPRNATGAFLVSKDSFMNLELIGSLPNRGLSHVRIHWLLELLEVVREREQFYFNFTRLDAILDHLRLVGLHPGFELMGVPKESDPPAVALVSRSYPPSFWTDMVQQLVGRYAARYGVQYVSRWRFETWNEPDLRSYNLLNFTVNDYLSYVYAIRDGLRAAAQRYGMVAPKRKLFPLYGPAGLFKSVQHHPFCWSAVKACSANITHGCPFDTITFHRKGSGRWASEVLDGGRELLEDVLNRFPPVGRLKFANDEADPVAGWSSGRPFQADVRYAAMLFSIVTQHWSAIATQANELGRRLHFLSHDNAFLSYYPYVFEQRTLFARFQMNLTKPPHVQFIAKPVFSVLGLLANLAPVATATQFLPGNISYVLSVDEGSQYVCLVASRSNDSSPLWEKRSYLNITIPVDMVRGARAHPAMVHRVSCLVEGIQDGRNDPFRLWQLQGRPAYPTTDQLAAMREMQLPSVLHAETRRTVQFGTLSKGIDISLSLRGPWIVSVRLCSADYAPPGRVHNVRVRTVFRNEIIVHWHISIGNKQQNRCIQTYEVWFKATKLERVAGNGRKETGTPQGRWRHINAAKHTPFMFYQYARNIRSPAAGTQAACKEAILRRNKTLLVFSLFNSML